MIEDIRIAFGLRDDDEVVAVGLILLIAAAIAIFLLRGCGPAGELLVLTDANSGSDSVAVFSAPEIDGDSLDSVDSRGNYALSGSYLPNTELDVLIDGSVVGQTFANADGKWQFSHQLPEDKEHLVKVVGLAGVGAGVSSAEFIINSSNPSNVVIERTSAIGAASSEDDSSSQPLFSSSSETEANRLQLDTELDGTSTEAGLLIFTGVGFPNSPVNLLANGVLVGAGNADADGNWSIEGVLDESQLYIISAEQTIDDSRNLSNNIVVTINEPEAAIVAPVAVAPTAAATSTVAPTATPEPEPEPTATSMPEATVTPVPTAEPTATTAPPVVETPFSAEFTTPEIKALQSGEEARVLASVAGAGPAGQQVRILLGNNSIQEVEIASDGSWSYDIDLTLPPEQYRLSAVLLDAEDEAVESTVSETSFLIELDEEEETSPAEGGSGTVQVRFSSDAEPDENGDESVAATDVLNGSTPVVELILDASWSMRVAIDADDTSRIGIAKSALRSVVNDVLPDGIPVAFRAFGNVEGNYACRTDLMLPLQVMDRDILLDEIDDVFPIWNANTPIAASLAAVQEDLAGATGPITVVLLTDGEETCEGDPAEEIRKLRDLGIDLKVNIVGLAIDDQALKDEFTRWAEIGGGTYIDVSADSDELAAALGQSLLVPYDVLDQDGAVVATSTIGGTPVRLPTGEFTLVYGGIETPVVVAADDELIIELAP